MSAPATHGTTSFLRDSLCWRPPAPGDDTKSSRADAVQARSDAEGFATQLEGLSLTFTAKAGEEGRLYGSVTAADIAEALAKEGHEVDRRIVQLEEPIKDLGVYAVPIRLHAEVEPEVKVWVVAEE